MLSASVLAPDASDVALELAAIDMLSHHEASELPSSNAKPAEGGSGASGCCGFLSRSVRSPFRYFQLLHREFQSSLLVLLMSNYVFLKGAAYHMAIAASTPVFREVLKLQAEQHSVATALFMIPWSIKGIIGAFSDLFAFGGYHKRSYMLLASLTGVLGSVLLVSFAGSLTMGLAVAGFFMIMVQASFNDLLCEGTYTRRMAEKPYTGAALTSFVWLGTSLGTFVQAVWVGPVVDHLPFHIVLLPFVPFCIQQFVLLLWPWPFKSWSGHSGVLREEYTPPANRFKWRLLSQHKRVFICAICLTFCAFGSMVAGLQNDSRHIVGIVYWLSAGVAMTATVVCTMPAYLAKPVLYLFLSRMLVPNITSQFSYWLRAGPDCVVGGPNFSWTFLLTWNALAQAFFAFVGVALFQRFVSKWTFRRAFLITSLLQQLTSVFDVAMVMRWNIKMGIPDNVWYFCSASIIEEVASMWAFMPGCVLISRLCPKNLESTMYAVVAGLQNFGQSMAKFLGNFICFTLMHIRTLPSAEGGCNFDSLPLAIGVSSGVSPLVPILLTFVLIPSLLMDEPFEIPEHPIQKPAEEADAAAAAAAAAAVAEPAAALAAEPAAAAAAAKEQTLSPPLTVRFSPSGSGLTQQKSASAVSALGLASTNEPADASDREPPASRSSSGSVALQQHEAAAAAPEHSL
ncbi:hypothetical protein Efla_004398 [Eimeria flavescens]